MMMMWATGVVVQLAVLASAAAASGSPERTRDTGRRGIVVVGSGDENWSVGRVEDVQLKRTARNLGYDVETLQVHGSDEVPCRDSWGNDDVLVYLPRSEGLLQKSPEDVLQLLQDLGASIAIPQGEINVLVGVVGSVRRAMISEAVGSLGSLPAALRQNYNQHKNLYVDNQNKVFIVLDNDSKVGNTSLELREIEKDHKVLQYGDFTPCVVVAQPDSVSAQTLMLITSDYLAPTLHQPSKGAASTSPKVVVGVYIKVAQPYLDEFFKRLSEMDGDNTHIYIYNMVSKYHSRLVNIQQHLEEKFGLKYVTLIETSGNPMDIGAIKNMIIGECVRLQCDFYMNLNPHMLIDERLPMLLVNLDLPVVTPAIKMQFHDIATFVRGGYYDPSFLDDMEHIVDSPPNERRLWHASCVQAVYVIRRDILEQLPTLYSHPNQQNSEISLCENLREAGIPMYIHGGFADIRKQHIINSEDYKIGSPDILSLDYNEDIWTSLYLDPLIVTNNTTHIDRIRRPCHEVYDFPLFSSKFTEEAIQLAEQKNKWAINRKQMKKGYAMVEDDRKKTSFESVPTVDQYLEHLGLNSTNFFLYAHYLMKNMIIAYPQHTKVPPHISLIARFQASEQPGLPFHHDSSGITAHINLTPAEQYEGGWLEFPVQGGCRIRPEAGRFIIHPGRLTHPKIMHNVTQGMLHKMIILYENISYDNDNETMEAEKVQKTGRPV